LSGSDPAERFLACLGQSLADGSFVKLVLARPRKAQPGAADPGDADLQRVLVRRIMLKGAEHLSFVFRHATRDVTKNLPLDEGVA
jgi:hypothetical protein